jgi:hypothetical protein
MNARYFDAAYLCKLYWPEHGSPEVATCAMGVDEIVCGLHGRAEFYSVGHRKLREGVGDSATLMAVFSQFEADRAAGGIRFLPLTDMLVDRIAVVFAAAPANCFLRAADAVHLATAAEYGFKEIYSNDHRLLGAAPLFRLQGINVIP